MTRSRQRKHKKLRRKVHICLLDYSPGGGRQTKFTEFWINERSRVCSASMNERITDADLVWIYCKDPIPPDKKGELLRALERARPGTPVINHPEVYNAYHEERTFKALAEAGVSVPRAELTDEDIGKTLVIYKTEGRHGHAPKFLSQYEGPKAGCRAFEFVDSRDPDGLYRRYRAYHILGAVYPSLLRTSGHWNVYSQTAERTGTFTMAPTEVDQIRLIAKTLGLQYFAVDYLRRKEDDSPMFVDVNVYPDVISKLRETGRKLGYYGRWHTLDTDAQWLSRGNQTPHRTSEHSFWNVLDEAILSFLQKSRHQESSTT